MPLLLKKRDTMTDQVVRHLENAIAVGELKPCSRIKSVRELATMFGVSFRVISTALDRLEERKLITRKDRSGIYVSDIAYNPQVTDALIFVFGDNPWRSPFANLIAGVATSRAAAGRFDFFTRFVTIPYEFLNRHDYLYRRLDAEVARLSKQLHPEVALVAGFRFRHDDVRRCLELPFPLLFVGDFADGDFPDLAYNRIGTTHDFFREPLQWAAGRSAKKIALFIAEDLERGRYLEQAVGELRRDARECDIEVNIIPVPDTHGAGDFKRKAGLNRAAEIFRAGGGADLIVLDHIFDIEHLFSVLRHQGYKPLSPELEVIGCDKNEVVKGVRYIECTPGSVDDFHSHICQLMNLVKEGKLIDYKEQFRFTKEII